MDLPSFLWLWKIAAWSMGLLLTAYGLQAITGLWIRSATRRPMVLPLWIRWVHLTIGLGMVGLVLVLLTIGIVGTLGYYGSLGHSFHLPAGILVVGLVLLSAWSAFRIRSGQPGARSLHGWINVALFGSLLLVLGTGWVVVQKYLP